MDSFAQNGNIWMQLMFGIVVFIALLVVIGYIATKRTKSNVDFAVAGRSLGPLVIAVCMVSTYGSASSYLGNGGLAYSYGWPMAWIWIGCVPGIIIPTLLLGPRMRMISARLNTLTIPDFLSEIYESKFLRTFISMGIILFYVPMMIAQFKGIGVLFSTFFDIPFLTATLVFGVIMILYCASGGLLAVAWTDLVQGIFMAALMLILVPFSIYTVGGWSAMNAKLVAIDATLNNIFEPKLFTPLTAFFMVIYYWLWQVGQPYMSTRYFALKDVQSFKKLIIYLIIFTTIISGAMWAGTAGRILFPNLADPDSVVPMFIKTYFPTYFGVLAIIGILAAILTTIAGVLITVGTTVGHDLVNKTFNKKLNEKQALRVTQLSTFVIGGLSLAISMWKTPEFLSLLVYAALGGMACMVVGPVLMAVYDKKATKEGAILGSILGTSLFLFLIIVPGYNAWISGATGMLTSIICTFIFSRIVGVPSKNLTKIHDYWGSVQKALHDKSISV
jgi:sodium/pantothenate symporter